MKIFIKSFLVLALGSILASCIREQLDLLGEVKADIQGESFEAFVSTGVLTQVDTLGNVSKNLVFTGTDVSKFLTLSLTEASGIDTVVGPSVGTYAHDTPLFNGQVTYIENGNNFTTIIISSKIVLTESNGEEEWVSGEFEAVLASDMGDTLEITNGVFKEVAYTIR